MGFKSFFSKKKTEKNQDETTANEKSMGSTQLKKKGKLSIGGGIYTGVLVNGKAYGQGTLVFPDGKCYSGEFKENQYCENGVLTFSNGIKYQGKYKNNKAHGQGELTYPDGNTFSGNFFEDGYMRKGSYIKIEESLDEDNLVEESFINFDIGLSEDEVDYSYRDGEYFENEWNDEEQDKLVIYKDSYESLYMGEFKNGDFHGQGMLRLKDGTQKIGEFRAGRYVE